MILLLGSTGYIGSAFVLEMRKRGLNFHAATHEHDKYQNPFCFERLLTELKPELVINCSAFIPTPSVDLCKDHKTQTTLGNVLLPDRLAGECAKREIPFTQLSTGCLFNEVKAYTEDDLPTRGFGGYCGFYVGTKLLCEELVSQNPKHYILRLRLPFDEIDHSRNYLSKLASFPKVFNHVNSLSHRGDFVKAALDLWELRAPFGIYHVANPGFISAKATWDAMFGAGFIFQHNPEFVDSPDTTGCTLSVKKLLDAGVKIRDVHEAIDDALTNWKAAQ